MNESGARAPAGDGHRPTNRDDSKQIQRTSCHPCIFRLHRKKRTRIIRRNRSRSILRSTGDKEHDRRRIKTIFGTLISFHGRDRFSFQIFEDGKGYLIDFPNDTTRVCTEVLERLKKLMGEESWRVEEITFQ